MINLRNKLIATFFILSAFFIIAACSEDDSGTDPNADEFVADDQTFNGWENWLAINFTMGPDPALGQAHGGNNEEATRTIFINDENASLQNGEYPQGTVIVKQTHDGNGDQIGLTAMVKRGGDFNEAGAGWEWFMWDENGDLQRGADLMNGACQGCHNQAATTDYVFSSAEEFSVSEAIFDNYASWYVVAVNQGPDEALGAAHAGNDQDATRTIYFMSPNLMPTGNGDYPWGAAIIKEVKDGDGKLIGLTAMVKRGGDFNPNADGWYWYRWVIDDNGQVDGIMAEGAVDGCNGCHAQAAGSDYVFTTN